MPPSESSSVHTQVAVVGGGPAGSAAALAAARTGVQVTLFEKHPLLGGMGTAALVNNFCNAYYDKERFIIGGIFEELRADLIARGALYETRNMEPYEPTAYAELLQEKLDAAGVNIIYGRKVLAARESEAGVELDLDDGTTVFAEGVVDATGDAIIAHAAGIPTTFGRDHDNAVMPMTMCYRIKGIDLDEAKAGWPNFVDERNGEHRPVYTDPNTGERNFFHTGYSEFVDPLIVADREAGLLKIPRDHVAVIQGVPGTPGEATVNYGRVFVDDPTDPDEFQRATEEGKEQVHDGINFFRRRFPGFENVELVEMALQMGVRQSHQIVGLHRLTAREAESCIQFEDVIAQCCYMIDIHEPGSDKSTCKPFPKGKHFDIPWRSLVPKDGHGRLVAAGRCISAEAGAMASFRVQPSAMAIGEAAGAGIALAVKHGTNAKDLDYTLLRDRLLEGNAILT